VAKRARGFYEPQEKSDSRAAIQGGLNYFIHFCDFAHYTKAVPVIFLNAESVELGQDTFNYRRMAANIVSVKAHIFVEQDEPFVCMSALEVIRLNFNYLKAPNL
jgi:hypothetical protein